MFQSKTTMANLLRAVYRVINNPITEIQQHNLARNRANSVGEALEKYIIDLFSNTFEVLDVTERNRIHSDTFSYIGNQNNPPDIILKNGDAIETKKVESPYASLALNSSYPKSKLYSDSPLINKACRMCEDKWVEKDIIYCIGHTNDTQLKYLWMIYGDCFSASKEVYERIKNTISEGVNNISDVEFAETKEIGKVKKVDPLGITDLRIRGMWHIENPHSIFDYLDCDNKDANFQLNVLMRLDKFETFPEEDRQLLMNMKKQNYSFSIVEFKDPDNPAVLLKGIMIKYSI